VKASKDFSVTGYKQQQDMSESAQWAWPCGSLPFVFSDSFAYVG